MIEFLAGPLTNHPLRVGKPLRGPLTGCYGARRGTYRIVHQVDSERWQVNVLDIDHRSSAYHRR